MLLEPVSGPVHARVTHRSILHDLSAGYGTGHIESNECIGTSPVFRASTPSHIQEPSVPTKMVAPGQSFQRFNTPTQHLQQTTTLQPPPAGNPRPVVSSPSACAAGVLRGAASWFEPNSGTTQERYPPQPDTTANRSKLPISLSQKLPISSSLI